MPESVQIKLNVGPELFRFESRHAWIHMAPRCFEKLGATTWDTICIDAAGRVCNIGKQFSRAEEEGTYPITCYWIDPNHG